MRRLVREAIMRPMTEGVDVSLAVIGDTVVHMTTVAWVPHQSLLWKCVKRNVT